MSYFNTLNLIHSHKLQQHWRGIVRPAEPYQSFDLVLVDTDGSTAALVTTKDLSHTMDYWIEQRLPLSYETVRSLRVACRERKAVPLIMVACQDDEFLIDLRDESGVSVRQLSHDTNCLVYAGARFLPLFTLPRLL